MLGHLVLYSVTRSAAKLPVFICLTLHIHSQLCVMNNPHLFSLTQHTLYFNSLLTLLMYAACFDLYLCHPQARQYKNHTKENTIKSRGPCLAVAILYNVKTWDIQYKVEDLFNSKNVYTQVIRKVTTVCAYLSRILETVTLRMCSDFLYQLRSHRRHFVKFVLCLCLFLCVKHV